MTTKVPPALLAPVGQVLQTVYIDTTDYSGALNTTIPFDNSKPQNTEGTEWLTVSITPKLATSKLLVRFTMWGNMSAFGTISAALFRDSGADAVDASAHTPNFTGHLGQVSLESFHDAGSTSTTTFKVRVGPTSGNLYVNGLGGARYFGGASKSTLIVQEIAA